MKLFLCFFYSLFICCCFGINQQEKESEILDSILDGYDTRVAAKVYNETTGKFDATVVTVNFFVRSIEEIDEKNMDIKMQLTLRMQWNDNRLAFNSNGINYVQFTNFHKIWKPDVFISNEKEAHLHDVTVPNVLIRISPNGSVMYSQRLTLKMSCPMNLRYFPNNGQICDLKLASYGYSTDNVVLQWKKDGIQVTKNTRFLARYRYSNVEMNYCTSRTTTGEYSCLKGIFTFESIPCNYWKQIYIPCAILLLISYLTLWLSNEQFKLRIIMSLISFAVLFTKLYVVKSPVPDLSYFTSHDYWSLCSILLSFFVIFETVVGFGLENFVSNVHLSNGEIDTMLCGESGRHISKGYSLMMKLKIAKLIDICSRVAFIVIFLIIYGISL